MATSKSSKQQDYLPFNKAMSDYGIRIIWIWILWCIHLLKLLLLKSIYSAQQGLHPTVKRIRNSVPDECFNHCKLGMDKMHDKMRRPLFASTFPVSEYMDNINRVGHLIMNTNLHRHKRCKNDCSHPYVLDLQENIFKRKKCTYKFKAE